MLMPKKNRIAIYELLFKEGVMVAKKDVHMPKHPELADKNVPNLHVMKAMQVAGGAAGVGCRWRDFPLVFKANSKERSAQPELLAAVKGCESLKSRGYVKEQFAWRHFYWYLTNEGIQYLRDYLHLPPEIVPATLRRSRPETGRPRPKGLEGERPARLTRGEADRDTYRRSAVPSGADKKAEAGAGSATEFQFRGGFGRGRGQPPQ
ncbi:small ribosomal subunit protein eS10 isoform X1 [Physeter macrocephalus]|uniref:Small ribosomal subunit protein eS10 n=1 Tax=Physeter macrocephalus TaxID=9755 RepID=A0A9W2W909_PHYMC|nr:40S ribosomal protein S10 isoform X1 [Physeter catodon]